MLTKFSKEQYPYFLLLLIGTFLLSYNIFNAPLMNDELSVILRSKYDSIVDVFKKSIMDDVHPPLIQFFSFYWIKISGNNTFIIKLPFLLMGISSIALMFELAKKWFNKKVAFLSTAFFISTQLIVMYSQIARPYISGVFLVLLFSILWTKIIEQKSTLKTQILYVVIGACCLYNHYFSLLQVAIIIAVGVFFIPKQKLLQYIGLNALIGLSFVIFIPTMFKQMSYDGISYLATPGFDYIIEFIYYTLNYSIFPLTIVILGLLYSFFQLKKDHINKYHFISLLLFIIPFSVGFIYSIVVRPVMPFRSLIFCFPFLAILLFSLSVNIKKNIAYILTLLFLISNVYALTINRKHYTLFHKGIISEAIQKTDNYIKQHKNPYVIFNERDTQIKYYQNKYRAFFDYDNIFEKNISPIDFRKKIKKIKVNDVIAFNLPPNFISIIKADFPTAIEIDYGCNFNYYYFSKIGNEIPNRNIVDTTLTFDENNFYLFKENEEWGPGIQLPIGELINDTYFILECKIDVLKNIPNSEGHLVFEIKNKKETICWRSSNSKEWIVTNDNWQTMYFTVQLNEVLKKHELSDDLTLNVYFWNEGKQIIAIDNLSIKIKKGNNLIYSLYEDFS